MTTAAQALAALTTLHDYLNALALEATEPTVPAPDPTIYLYWGPAVAAERWRRANGIARHRVVPAHRPELLRGMSGPVKFVNHDGFTYADAGDRRRAEQSVEAATIVSATHHSTEAGR